MENKTDYEDTQKFLEDEFGTDSCWFNDEDAPEPITKLSERVKVVVKNLNYRIEDCDMIANALSRDGKSGHMMSWGKKGKIMKRIKELNKLEEEIKKLKEENGELTEAIDLCGYRKCETCGTYSIFEGVCNNCDDSE